MMVNQLDRNSEAIQRILSVPVKYPFSFVIIGDPTTGDFYSDTGVFSQLLSRIKQLESAPLFIVCC